jgi:hypothetical protein
MEQKQWKYLYEYFRCPQKQMYLFCSDEFKKKIDGNRIPSFNNGMYGQGGEQTRNLLVPYILRYLEALFQ